MKQKPTKQAAKHLSNAIAAQTISLITTSFGLVAALAWNEAIKEYVTEYIKPYFAKGSGVISLFIYAVAITIFSVLITIQLTKLLERLAAKKV
jgi:hypothetical protein